jgi:hypothetical protein
MKYPFSAWIVFLILSHTNLGLFAESNPHHCSVFTIAKGNQVFFGGNDDYIYDDQYYWVDPGDSTRYGVIWIGYPDDVQQGVNEAGLAYDANGLPRFDVNPHNERAPVEGEYTIYPIRMMRECATVEEVIEWVNTHQWHTFMHDQMQFADKTGDAVIISAGKDGEVVFTRKTKGNGFIVSTNFNVANPENSFFYPCQRYDRATEILNELIHSDAQLTLSDARDVLEAIHVENVSSWTIVSTIADLTNGQVYVYFFWQYNKPLIINVKEELDNPRPASELSLLFPEEVRKEAKRRYDEIQSKRNRCHLYGTSWGIAIILSLILFFVFAEIRQRKSALWILAMIFLGPLAFLSWLIFARNMKSNTVRNTIQEVMGDLIPVVISYFAVLTVMLLIPSLQANWPLQLVVVFGLPVLFTWLVFHVPLLFNKSDMAIGKFMFARLPHTIAVTLLGMGGIIALSLALVNISFRLCPVFPFSMNTVFIWWSIVVMGGVIAAILIYIFEYWSVKRGYIAWTALVEKDIKVNTQSWKRLWWVMLLCLAVLILCLAAGVALNNLMS